MSNNPEDWKDPTLLTDREIEKNLHAHRLQRTRLNMRIMKLAMKRREYSLAHEDAKVLQTEKRILQLLTWYTNSHARVMQLRQEQKHRRREREEGGLCPTT